MREGGAFERTEIALHEVMDGRDIEDVGRPAHDIQATATMNPTVKTRADIAQSVIH